MADQGNSFPHTQEKQPPAPPDECNCCYSTAAASIAIAEAVADATAEATAYASAYASASVWLYVMIAILIGIAVVAIAVAIAQAFASALAIAIAIAIAVAIAVAIAIAIAAAAAGRFRRPPAHRCTVMLDLPSTTSLANPLPPAVVWETIHAPGAHHVDVVESHDGGVTFTVVKIDATTEAKGLPITGSFLWKNAKLSPAGTLFLVVAIAYDPAGRELCRSRVRSMRILP